MSTATTTFAMAPPASRALWSWLAVACLVASLSSLSARWTDPSASEPRIRAAHPQPVADPVSADDAADDDTAIGDDARVRAAILDLVRHHRRTADAEWCERIADAVYFESIGAGIDPLMVASIVARESSFQTQVVSHAGAVGLMQLRPFVARDVASRSNVPYEGTGTLHDPETNVRLGVLYLQELIDRFDGDAFVALAAYHRGPTRVSGQIQSGGFGASRYAERILGLYQELSLASAAPGDEAPSDTAASFAPARLDSDFRS